MSDQTMTTVDILRSARDLISDEKRWTQSAEARDDRGSEIRALSPKATCFCAIGAIAKASEYVHFSNEINARDLLRKQLGGGHTIVSFNDTHTHAEVLAVFDRAISRAESDAA